MADWENRWTAASEPPPSWTPWIGTVFPDVNQPADEKFAARLDDLLAQTKAEQKGLRDTAADSSAERCSGGAKDKASPTEPEPLSDYALRLVHHVVRVGMPSLPASLVVWPYYHEFWEGTVAGTWMDGVTSSVWNQGQEETVDLGHAEILQCGWGPALRYGQLVSNGKCEVQRVRFGVTAAASQLGSSKKSSEEDLDGEAENTETVKGGCKTLELTRLFHAFNALDRAAQDLGPCSDIRAYADTHPGELDEANLTSLAVEHNTSVRGLLRAMYYTIRFLHIHKDDLPSLPPWEPWAGDVLTDRRADPACFTDLITDGRLSEYGFHLADHVLSKGVPKRPQALTRAADKAAAWKRAQTRAKGCQHCRKQVRTITADRAGAVCSAGASSGHSHTHTPDMTWSIDVFPSCNHSASERDSGGGGGSSFSGGGGGFSSSFDSGGFSSSF